MKVKQLISHVAWIGIVLLLLGPILFFIEKMIVPEESATNPLKITIIAILFFAYTVLSLFAHQRLLLKRSGLLITYYLLDKLFRLLVGIALLVLYKVYGGEGIILFAVNLFIYYLVTALLTTVYTIKAEKSEYKR